MRVRGWLLPACVIAAGLPLLAACTSLDDGGRAQGTTTSAAPDPPEVDLRDHGARCDGRSDDRAALESALAVVTEAGSGTVAIPPGRCRILTTADDPYVEVGDDVQIRGAGRGRSSLVLESDEPGEYRELLHTEGSDITISELTLAQGTSDYGVMVRVGEGRGITLRDVRIDGRPGGHADSEVHGVMFADHGTISEVMLDRVDVQGFEYGLLQASEADPTVAGVTVHGSHFEDNEAEDLGFNSPNGRMSDIVVRGNTFSGGDGFAIALANVDGATIDGNDIRGYRQEFIHVEDRSRDVRISGNDFSGNRRNDDDWYSFIFVISGSTGVTITDNRFVTEPALRPFRCIYVGTGGSDFEAPSDVVVSGNEAEFGPNSTLVDVYGDAGVTVRP